MGGPRSRRWTLKGLDGDRLIAALLASTWPSRQAETIEEEAGWIGDIMSEACDFSMPRAGRPGGRRATYWWSAELAELRRASGRTWRRLSRARRRGTREEVDAHYRELQERRSCLRAAIRGAKARAWEELLQSVKGDPWGRPYRFVMGKLRPWSPPETETMDPLELRGALDSLFPAGEGCPEPPEWMNSEQVQEISEIGQEKWAGVLRRFRGKRAPGPDGIPSKTWARAMEVLSPQELKAS
ncbi:uncharacterized protein LOC113562418 [Ooceraea biroi]|uniref:uncharacterized protein LOC113562418 n=1 Tax=Ooceraea biroi TaxID=2015173 RepID=UPI000F095EDA|nr:uncharacterized protein LOC113562418 [Ooceraea biroi]